MMQFGQKYGHVMYCRCLAQEADMNAHAQLVPPPLAALRAYSAKLQAQLQEV